MTWKISRGMLNYNKCQEIFTAHSHMYTLAGVSIILVLSSSHSCLAPGYERKRDPGNEVGVHVNTSIPDAF